MKRVSTADVPGDEVGGALTRRAADHELQACGSGVRPRGAAITGYPSGFSDSTVAAPVASQTLEERVVGPYAPWARRL